MENKGLIKNISLFTFFNVINAAIPFLLLPILTKFLSPEDYAIVDVFYNISLLATPVIGLSIVQSISRFYFEKIDISKFIATVFIILMVIGLSIIVLSLMPTLFWRDAFESLKIPPSLVTLALIYTLFSQVGEILLTLWRVSYKTLNFGFFRVFKTFTDLGISLLFIVGLGKGWEGRVGPQVFTAFLFGIIAIVILYRNGFLKKFRIHKLYKKEALSFSTPLVFHSLGASIIGFSDRFFILFILGLSNVGIYSVGYQIGMVLSLIQNSFNQAWVPFFYNKLNEGKEQEKLRIVKITYVYFGALLVLAILISLCTPFIYRYFIGDSFADGAEVVIWILLGYTFQGMYKMAVNYLFFLKKTKLITYCTMLTVFVNFILNYFLINKNGIIGAAQATLVSFVILFAIVFLVSKRSYKMPWGFFLKK
jgi:O-antigen/teichoic acid export membrane protein